MMHLHKSRPNKIIMSSIFCSVSNKEKDMGDQACGRIITWHVVELEDQTHGNQYHVHIAKQ